MAKIYQLSPKIIAKIAAGEIIERPAYAVKELLDNAIDAGANNIEIEIEQSGLKKIKVTDNGEGMTKEDLLQSFKSHTTSKIYQENDLSAIKTLGFRGEALASIAAISDLTIQSRTKPAVGGSKIEILAGQPSKITSVGMPVGTTIIIKNLFNSVPARKKFLKSSATEFRHMMEIVTNIALAYPAVKIIFTHNNKIVFNLPKNQTRSERIKILLGTSLSQNLIPLVFNNTYINISGFIAHPQTTSMSTQKQFLFINNRRVVDKLFSSTIKDTYGNLLESTSYPIFILFLDLPYETVDVNIHPRKEQVSFTDQNLIYSTLQQAIKETLQQNNLAWSKFDWEKDGLLRDHDVNTNSYLGQILKEEIASWNPHQEIQQIHNLYLMIQTKKGVVFIDQHAADERIIYEKLKLTLSQQKEKLSTHQLVSPVILDLSYTEAAIIHEYLALFQQLGLEIEQFKDQTYVLRAISSIFTDRDLFSLVQEIIDQISEGKNIKDLDVVSDKIITYLACRFAVMAGDALTKPQAKKLLENLEKTPNNATCPHGRPTKIELSLNSLNKSFKRS